jgi:hypothetical protein
MKIAVITFGRFNAPTIGHEKLIDTIKSIAKKEKASPLIFLSHTQDKKKNPLSYDEKYAYMQKAFGNIVQKSDSRNIIQVLKELQSKFDSVIIVVGSDRVEEFKNLTNKYNNKEYTYQSISVISAGQRDPDAEGVTGMSASKLRSFASMGDFEKFKMGVPSKLTNTQTKALYDTIRKNMAIKESESLEEVLTFQQRMKRRQILRRLKSKIKLGRRRAKFKLANKEKLEKRSARAARQILRTRFAGSRGAKYKELPIAARVEIDKRLEGKKALIKRLSKRLMPKVRKAEQERLKSVRQSMQQKNESVQLKVDDIQVEMSLIEYQDLVNLLIDKINTEIIDESVNKNLQKKSVRYSVPLSDLQEKYLQYKDQYQYDEIVFDILNHELLGESALEATRERIKREKESDKRKHTSMIRQAKIADARQRGQSVSESLSYHIDNKVSLYENIYRVGSNKYFELYREAKELYSQGLLENIDPFEKELLETDIGEFSVYENRNVPLDCPMIEEEENVELNKPKRGGPKKYYVYVKDPSSGNVKKVTFGDTTGLTAKINDPAARKSFVARHQCDTKKDKTSPGYWACRLPMYAKQLGLSGGGNFFW